MLLRVTAIEYDVADDEELLVYAAGRGQDGRRYVYTITEIPPYGYFPDEVTIDKGERVVRIEHGFESYDGEPLKRVTTRLPKHVGQLADEVECDTFEADIPFYRRVAIDGLSGYIEVPYSKRRVRLSEINTSPNVSPENTIEPKVVIGDIEVLPTNDPFSVMKNEAKTPIVNITLWDSYEDDYVVMVVDPEKAVDTREVLGYIEDHWDGYSGESAPYTDASTWTLKRCPNERALLEEYLIYMESRRPDVVSGWNWIKFDHEYILDRMDALELNKHRLSDAGAVSPTGWNTERCIDGLPAFDMMEMFTDKMSFHEWRSKKLDYVANEELGVGKVEHVSIRDDYENNPSRLLAYNIIDVQLTVELDRVNDIHGFAYELADLCSIMIYDVFSEMREIDGYIISRGGIDEILPSVEEKEVEKPAGGLVLTPSDGVSQNIGIFDVKSLYPSIIITCNISPETMASTPEEADVVVPMMVEKEADVGGKISAEDIEWDISRGAMGFSLGEEGIIPKYLKQIFENRNAAKKTRNTFEYGSPSYKAWDRRQAAIKVVMNAMYGVMASKYWRLGQTGLGDAVTSGGRYTLWVGSVVAEEMGYPVTYGDTDSNMISLSSEQVDIEELLDRGKSLLSDINDEMDRVADAFGIPEDGHPHLSGELHGTDRHTLVWEFEKVYESFLQAGKKKRYAGLLCWKEGNILDPPEIDITGMESQRSDTPEVVSDVQPEVIEMILKEDSFDNVSEYIRDEIEYIRDPETPIRRFALPGTINKPLEEYPNRETPRACEFSNRYLGKNFEVGDEPWVVYVRRTPIGIPDENVIALDWNETVPDGYELDYPHIIERAIEKPLTPVLKEVKWHFDDLVAGDRPVGIEFESSDSDPFASTARPKREEPEEPEAKGVFDL